MSIPFNKTVLFERNSLLILILGIFFLDSITPLNLSVWLLYLLPLTLVRLSPSERDPYYLAMVVTVLIGVGGGCLHGAVLSRKRRRSTVR